ncbi:iron-containing alcohol dehydrogenase [Arenicella xantha]|uniref:Alcohol dehydrogenase n=1 Tax=Arenicella xantha TaxID=644221 RepID=A0A395JHW9_9GAMM|nr:iron-containing alcohol dehydrogenase [Arenicella xantha]RBP48320.1 alcohol dehydrogenase [Arenicella xantha]
MNQFKTVPNILFGAGCSKQLADVCKSSGIRKPFIVTDNGVLACGLLDRVMSSIPSATIYSEVIADPPAATVEHAAQIASGDNCDAVIGFGGGSSMDVAKLVAVLMGGEQQLAKMYGVGNVVGSRVPLIQVPTTAGTGSEATAVAIVTTGEHTKSGVVSDQLFADTIILDPELTLGLPASVTAATGIDAMVHAIEAFTSKRLKNPISDMFALRALALLSGSIHAAVSHGDDIMARSDMLLGAMLAGQAFANAPVGAVHALAYPLGGIYHIPHGLSNSLVLPYVLRFNATAALDQYDTLAAVILESTAVGEGAMRLSDYFLQLAGELELPTTLRAVGIPEDGLSELAEQSQLQQRLLINNPREVSLAESLTIYQQAY